MDEKSEKDAATGEEKNTGEEQRKNTATGRRKIKPRNQTKSQS